MAKLTAEQRKFKLANDEPGPLLRELGIPAMMGMLITALNNVIDTIFIGHALGMKAVGGLAIVFPLQMIFLAVAQAIGTGGGSIVSISLGKNRIDDANRVLGNVFTFVTIFSLLFLAAGVFYMRPILRMFGATEAIIDFAKSFAEVTIWGFFFYAMSMALSNIVRAEGNTMVALMSRVVGAVVKIVLTPVFLFVFRWGMEGAALSSVIANVLSLVVIMAYMFSKDSLLKLKLSCMKPDFKIFYQISVLGSSVLIRYMAGSIVAILVNNTLSYYGQYFYIAMYGIIYRMKMFIFQPLFGLGQGMQPIVGFAVGTMNIPRIIRTLKLSFLWATIISVIGWGLIVIFNDEAVMLFGSSKRLVENGDDLLLIANIMLPTAGFQIIAGTMFTALGKGIPSMIVSLSRQTLFFIPLLIILPLWYEAWGVWYAIPLSEFLSFLVCAVMVWLEFRNLKRLEKAQEQAGIVTS